MKIGMIGYAFMGAAHSHAWRTAGRFFDLPATPELAVVCGRSADKVAAAAAKFGWESAETDWRAVVDRPDIDVIDICTPGDSHAEIAIAALAAGKHVLCEKPLANTVEEASRMAAAAASAAGRSMVMFNYRRVPALALARQLIADGRIGVVRQVRAQYLQDWLVDPDFPLTWRLDAASAGSGALGDLGAHSIDMAQFLTGQRISAVGGVLETFVDSRPLLDGSGRGPVTVDDAALFTARFDGGAIGVFEATRFATGRKNAMRIEVSGSLGTLSYDQESMNELRFYDGAEDARTAGFRRILVTESTHPYMDAWWPPGHIIGYEHTFIHQVRDFVTGVVEGTELSPSFDEGLQVQRVLDAVQRGVSLTEVGGA
ncbi:Gfo/Idh/MocA family protein [Kutzneria kofuensis]|uniref:Putative dehydrogenase n=1 Tax=Kutzneria kofuensis TaxID=103725 RepID=A0A7W9KNQ3_9PSEU|nr:Gfo/Idh/MocA family oxidoreductase [Kutzneria kofuensis]MBB5895189.1 putative dehydrogenase [Kutzneria kofuensis]